MKREEGKREGREEGTGLGERKGRVCRPGRLTAGQMFAWMAAVIAHIE